MTVRVQRAIELDAERSFRAFCDVEAVPRWVARVTRASVIRRHTDGLAAEVDFAANAADGSTVEYRLAYFYDREGLRVTWRPREGEEHAVRGFAAFEPRDDGCVMTYVLEYGEGWPGDREAEQARVEAVALAFSRHARRSAVDLAAPDAKTPSG